MKKTLSLIAVLVMVLGLLCGSAVAEAKYAELVALRGEDLVRKNW